MDRDIGHDIYERIRMMVVVVEVALALHIQRKVHFIDYIVAPASGMTRGTSTRLYCWNSRIEESLGEV